MILLVLHTQMKKACEIFSRFVLITQFSQKIRLTDVIVIVFCGYPNDHCWKHIQGSTRKDMGFYMSTFITKFLLHFVVVTFKRSWRTRLALFFSYS